MTRTTFPYIYFGGQIVAADQAKVHVGSPSFQYGNTCFGGIRGYFREGESRVFRLKDHYERLMCASKILNFGYYLPYEEFHEILSRVITENSPQGDFYIRPFIFTPEIQLAPRIQGLHFELGIYLVPLESYIDPLKGLNLTISNWRKFSDAALPTKAKAGGCYVNSALASAEAVRAGYDEALMMDDNGFIVEASVANILMVHHDRILVPEIGSAQLEGITLRTVVELLEEKGKKVHFEKIDRSMVYSCEELLLMGTAFQISFAASVDGRVIGSLDPQQKIKAPGPLCKTLREEFGAIIAKQHPKSKEWLTTF